ncbi:MAG: hypothetical protein CMK59_03470 [Proteobacteria bacterium]|nr:hypothetical protein [Pseudomonadota bacterium]
MQYKHLLTFGLGVGLSSVISVFTDTAEADPQKVKNYDPQLSLAPLAEALSPTVVNIVIEQSYSTPLNPFFGFENPENKIQTGQGSGFFISDDGYLLTNNHVVEGAETVTVKLSDGRSYDGSIIGTDDSLDIALIKIKGSESFPYVELGSSEQTKVGDWVVAIGNPYGLSHTVTSGIISAKGRVIGAGPYDDFLQTDASINPGNSGGPLFNLRGEVIGINTAINPRAQGIGFSVPIDAVSEILEDLKTKGHASRGWLGVGLGKDETEGAIVGEVYPNTPAAESGLKRGDKIVRMDNETIENSEDLIRKVGKKHANTKVNFDILRNGKARSITVVLGERPSQKDLSTGSFLNGSNQLGIEVSVISRFDSSSPSRRGLIVLSVSPSGPAANKLRPKDIILSCNTIDASSPEVLRNEMSQSNELKLQIERNGQRMNVTINL